MSDMPIIFADAMREANIANGVARLRMTQISTDGQVVPAGTLILPLSQLPGLAASLMNVLRTLETQARNAQEQRESAATEETATEETAA